MANIAKLLIEHMAIWTAADTEKKSGRGRASGNAGSVYGVKKLRELILELAVRGKLVPQDHNDEPASELLKRIQAEKAKLIAEGKLKKEKPLAPISEQEKPFELPIGWEWAKLNEVADVIRGVTYGKSDASDNPIDEHVPLLRGNNIDRILNFDKPVYVPIKLLNESQFIKKGDIVIAMSSGSADLVGKAAQAQIDFDGGFGAFCGVVRSYSKELFNYFRYFFQTPYYRKVVAGYGKGIGINNLQKSSLILLNLPIPPLAEQHRIVTKVDELMTLCDQLEQQHSNAHEAHETLVSQLLATLTLSQNAAEFNANWQRIYTHFDLLFTTEASIDALKQTLLQLAVMGKLVTQDPNDEPASELIKRIQAEKAKRIAEGKLKKEKPLTPIGDNEKPFELPNGWEWVRIGEICRPVSSGSTPSAEHFREKSGIPFLKVYNIRNQEIDFEYKPQFIDSTLHQSKLQRSIIYPGEVVMNIVGPPLGKVAIIPDTYPEWNCNQAIVFFGLIKPMNNKYVLIFFKEGSYLNDIELIGTAGQDNISVTKSKNILLPVPPLAEQHRIVAKVDALMSLCDQLKIRIQQANQQQQTIADALVAQALKPATAEVLDLAAYRAAITCNIIKRMQHNQAFGRTFAMKLLYLSQQHIGFETHLEFEREAAGPFDQWIYDFERDGIAAGWFGREEKQLSNGYKKIEYQVKSAIDEPLALMNSVGSTEQRKELERLFALFADKKTEEAEIVATLFAAWNDFLFDGVSPTDEQIIQEVRENWHSSKERFSPEQLIKWLNWLRGNNIVPTGKGSKTIYQAKLIH